MRFIIPLLTPLVFFATATLGQTDSIFKYKATKFQIVLKDNNGNFDQSDCMSETKLFIVENLASKRIKIYSNQEQAYDILDISKPNSDEYGNKWYFIRCLNEKGLRCNIREKFLASSDDENNVVLFVDFADTTYVYRMHLDKD